MPSAARRTVFSGVALQGKASLDWLPEAVATGLWNVSRSVSCFGLGLTWFSLRCSLKSLEHYYGLELQKSMSLEAQVCYSLGMYACTALEALTSTYFIVTVYLQAFE